MSRDIDKQIAEKVMGWDGVIFVKEGQHWVDTCIDRPGFRVMHGDAYGYKTKAAECHYLPHYSTSIADAWLVVNKMRESHGYAVSMQGMKSEIVDQYRVFFNLLDSCIVGEGCAKTAPLAICKAALNTLENHGE